MILARLDPWLEPDTNLNFVRIRICD
eukprot:SAG31_NODE_17820_length_656_cov_1.991023_1_plen_25_part_10